MGEIEITNLFGRLALDSSVVVLTDKIEEQKAIQLAMQTLLTAINNKHIKIDTDHIKGEVAVTAFPIGHEPLTNEQLRETPLSVEVATFPATQKVFADTLPLPNGAASETTLLAIKNLTNTISNLSSDIKTLLVSLDNKTTMVNTGSVVLSNFPGVTDEELRVTPLPVEVSFPDTQNVSFISSPLPANAATEVTLSAIKSLSDDIKLLVSGVKTLADSTNTLVSSINTKTTKVDTDNIAGTVNIGTNPLPTGAAKDSSLGSLITAAGVSQSSFDTMVSALTVIINKIIKQDTDHISGSVVVTDSPGLTNAELRATDVPVSLSELPLPTGAASELTLGSLATKLDDVLTKLNLSLIKANTDEVNISVGDLRLTSAIRTLSRLNYDATNSLRVTNNPIGTQTVTISTSGNTIQGSVNLFGLTAIAGNHILGKLSFSKFLDRIIFS